MQADEDMMLDIAPMVGVESIFVLLLSGADAARETLGVCAVIFIAHLLRALLCTLRYAFYEISDTRKSVNHDLDAQLFPISQVVSPFL